MRLDHHFLENTQHHLSIVANNILRHAKSVCEAVPKFIGTQLANSKTPCMTYNTVMISAYDLLPILLVHYAQEQLAPTPNAENNLLVLGYSYLLTALTSVLLFRNKMRFLVHATLLPIVYTKEFEKALKDRTQVSNSVCYGCTPGRLFKGDVRSLLVFVIGAQIVKPALKLFDVTSLFLYFFHVMLYGQIIGEYRLGSDGICDRHRVEYYHQHYELFFLLGFLHLTLSKITSNSLYYLTSMPTYKMEDQIDSMILLYLIGLSYHTQFPKPVENASRHFYDAVAMIRSGVNAIMELIIPGAKKKLDNSAEKRKKNMSWIDVRYKMIRTYQNKYIKKLLTLLLPTICRDSSALMNDFLIKHYWPAVFKRVISSIEVLEKAKAPALAIASLKEVYDDYIAPIKPFIDIVSKSTGLSLILACGKFLLHSNALRKRRPEANKFKNMYDSLGNLPKALYIIIIAALRDEKFTSDLSHLKKWMLHHVITHETEKADQRITHFETATLPEANLDGVSLFEVQPTAQVLDSQIQITLKCIEEPAVKKSPGGFVEISANDATLPSVSSCDWPREHTLFQRSESQESSHSDDWNDCDRELVAHAYTAPVFSRR